MTLTKAQMPESQRTCNRTDTKKHTHRRICQKSKKYASCERIQNLEVGGESHVFIEEEDKQVSHHVQARKKRIE